MLRIFRDNVRLKRPNERMRTNRGRKKGERKDLKRASKEGGGVDCKS